MPLSLSELKGMSAGMAKKLRSKGISDSDQLLNAVSTPQQRLDLSKELGVSNNTVLELANRAQSIASPV